MLDREVVGRRRFSNQAEAKKVGFDFISKITNLHFFKHPLTGPIPTEFGELSALYGLTLQNGQLNGVLPSELGTLPRLQQICFESTRLSDRGPPEVAWKGGQIDGSRYGSLPLRSAG